MPRNGSGTFNRIYNWATDAGNGIDIEASRMDGEFDGLATGLSNSIAKDGQTTITANIPFNSKKITTLANGSARTDSIALGQVQDNSFGTLGTLGGSADTYTATPLPAIKAYATGSEFNLKVNVDNTGASTLNVSAVAAKNIKKYDGAGSKIDLEAGDLQQDQYYKVIYDGTDFVLIGKNPVTTSTTSTAGQSLLPNSITISNGTDADHDIDFTAGNFNFDDGSGQAVATALTKQIDAAWVVGNNVGGLDTGTVTADATYYLFAIYNPTLTISDYLFSTSATSPTLPSGYTKKKRIASLLTDGAGDIRNGTYTFFNDGSYKFIYNMGLSVSSYSSNIPTTRQSIGVPVPEGIVVECLFLCNIQGTVANTGSKYFLISSLDKPDNLATFSNFSVQLNGQGSNENENFSSPVSEVYSNTTAQVGVRGNVSNFSVQTYLKGFIDSKL